MANNFNKAERYVKQNGEYKLLSYATSSESVEMTDGTNLQTKANAIDKAISDETTNRIKADTTITNNLNAEITRAKQAESNLDSKKVNKTTVATSSALGLVKSGTDITVDSSGNVSVNDNLHKHTVSNISDLTVTASELNVLDGITATTTELNYTDGVTSNIQTQLNGKSSNGHTHDDRYYTETEMNTKLNAKLNTSLKGSVNGLAELDKNGKVPSSQLPSYNAFSNITVGNTTIAADTPTDTLTLVAGSNITITPDATNDKITISSTGTGSGTDTKVTQTVTTSNASYPLLLAPTGQTATTTTTSYFGTKFQANPSTGELTAPILRANTVQSTGDVIANYGTSNQISLATHGHAYLNGYSQGTRLTSANLPTNTNGAGSIFGFVATSSMTEGKPPSDASILQMNWDNNSGFDCQIGVARGSYHMYVRGQISGTWGSWKTVLDSGNYTSYCLPLTGGTLTGKLNSSSDICVDNGCSYWIKDSNGTDRTAICLTKDNQYNIAVGGVSNTIMIGSNYTTATHIYGSTIFEGSVTSRSSIKVSNHNGIYCSSISVISQGTESSTGLAEISAGNSFASGKYGNTRGRIAIYGTNTASTSLYTRNNSTSSNTLYLPSIDGGVLPGTLYETASGSDSASIANITDGSVILGTINSKAASTQFVAILSSSGNLRYIYKTGSASPTVSGRTVSVPAAGGSAWVVAFIR